jgi:hypothetical protein
MDKEAGEFIQYHRNLTKAGSKKEDLTWPREKGILRSVLGQTP